MKFCKDCKWYRELHDGMYQDVCVNPKFILIDRVTGKPETKFLYCKSLRYSFGADCGKNAKGFEPRD